MKVLIEMSPEQYELFMAECDIKSPEYSILKNAIVPRDGDPAYNGDGISLLCDKDEATQLLQAARRFYPDAAASIARRRGDTPDQSHSAAATVIVGYESR